MSKYNGWTNYATWRLKLEMFDGYDPYTDAGFDSDVTAYDLGLYLKEYAEGVLEGDVPPDTLTFSYAMAFLSDVNWIEIAQHLIDEHKEESEA